MHEKWEAVGVAENREANDRKSFSISQCKEDTQSESNGSALRYSNSAE